MPSTRATCKARQNKFIQFCQKYEINEVSPVSQETLCYYVAYLGREGLTFSTIKGYLAALRNLQIIYELPSPFDTPTPKLDQVLRGIKITREKQGQVPHSKLPVTPTVLRQVRAVWSDVGSGYTHTLLWAAATTCFFSFLRVGEITLKVAVNKDFGHSQKWILTYQICNTVVLDHLFQF